jgi:RNA polymerase sigma-70 factor (ECF subfamily)
MPLAHLHALGQGFDAATIGSAFLVAPTTMAQRLVRAKSRIRQAGIPFRVPEGDELAERLDAVLEAIYAIYAEGWSDPTGTHARSRGLAEEAIWLGRLVVLLLPQEPEALGLLSLMLHAEAHRAARRDVQGDFIPLDRQDPARWDAALIGEAEALLLRASSMNAAGRFQLEAAVQSAHAARRLTGRTDWAAIVQLYDALLGLTGSVVVAINRAVALAGAGSAAEGLAALNALQDDARLAQYQPYWAARAPVARTRLQKPTGARSGSSPIPPCAVFSRTSSPTVSANRKGNLQMKKMSRATTAVTSVPEIKHVSRYHPLLVGAALGACRPAHRCVDRRIFRAPGDTQLRPSED